MLDDLSLSNMLALPGGMSWARGAPNRTSNGRDQRRDGTFDVRPAEGRWGSADWREHTFQPSAASRSGRSAGYGVGEEEMRQRKERRSAISGALKLDMRVSTASCPS